MSGNYAGNETSHAVKLRAAVLRVTDIACALNSSLSVNEHNQHITIWILEERIVALLNSLPPPI